MDTLDRLTLKGFKSIKDATIEFRPLNVLIGANGAGKSNLISFFKMLNEMIGGRLQQYIAVSGRAHSLLYHGPKTTPQIEAALEFRTDEGASVYRGRLIFAAGDTLVFAEETAEFKRYALSSGPSHLDLDAGHVAAPAPMPQPSLLLSTHFDYGAGHVETRIREKDEPAAPCLRHLLVQCRVYHFHDTSPGARARQYCYVGDNKQLQSDAGNLAAVLYRLRKEEGSAYQRIVGVVRLIAPYFDDFDLAPEGRDIILNWRELGSDQLFGPHQFSDGTLRAICLATLLLQPEDDQPNLIIVDEPELGLHPYALNIVADLFQKAAKYKQVLVSTQSSAFLDQFDPEDVIVVDRAEAGSTFKRMDAGKLASWLDEYTLGEIWEKNVVGGGPH